MAKITLTSFISIDGVVQGPGGPEEDPSGGFTLGGWVIPFGADPVFGRAIEAIYGRCEALLLGRSTYDGFRKYWPQVATAGNPVATAINTGRKYVASHTMTDDSWQGTQILRDPFKEIDAIRARHAGEVQVHGSAMLARALLERDVIDEINLIVAPVVLGRGKRLFGDESLPGSFALIASTAGDNGLIVNAYRRNGDVAQASAHPELE